MRKKIHILYTGGTIGMTKGKNGYEPRNDYLKQMLDSIPEIQVKSMPKYAIKEYKPLLDSANIDYEQWNRIARDIENNYKDYDGFLILHGTDTMAYTASALSFILEGLSKPVIITGSQIPLSEIRNDARENLIVAMELAQSTAIKEVCICFGRKILRGCRSVKISSNRLDPFESPNFPLLGEVGININLKNLFLNNYYKEENNVLKARKIEKQIIATIKIFPGIEASIFESMMNIGELKAIVIEAFGIGNMNSEDKEVEKILKKANEKGIVIVVSTQCLQGNVEIGLYETSHFLVEAGAISANDMTFEAILTKLYYLLSITSDTDEIKKQMQKNLRGEITEL